MRDVTEGGRTFHTQVYRLHAGQNKTTQIDTQTKHKILAKKNKIIINMNNIIRRKNSFQINRKRID